MSTSVKSCAATAALDAPSEKRTEISCCRALARDSSSAAMLMQAISSSRETEPNRIHRDLPHAPDSGVLQRHDYGLDGSRRFSDTGAQGRFARSARSARACARVMPGFKRPMAVNQVDSRLCAYGASGGLGRPQVHVAIGKMERGRHDADDGVRGRADAQRLADCVWLAPETAAPQAVADQHAFGPPKCSSCGREIAPQCWSDAQHLQKTRRHQRHLELLGKFAGEFRNVLEVVAGDRLARCGSGGSTPPGGSARRRVPGSWGAVGSASQADRRSGTAAAAAAPRRWPRTRRCWRRCRAPGSGLRSP